jgi:hypothetical protein
VRHPPARILWLGVARGFPRPELGLKFMAKIRRSGYILEWFVSDHVPRHIHVYDSKRRLIGRLDVDRMVGLEGWRPDQKLIELIQDLREEGRL